MDDTVVVAIFRHGLTEENIRKAYIGWTDSPLSELARNTLAACTSKLSPYERIVTSDLQRCLQTAKTLFPNQDPYPLPEFREMHFGDWETKAFSELESDPIYQEWLKTPFMVTPPKGENYVVFSERIESGWKKVIDMATNENLRKIAIVTHGGVIRYLLTKLNQEKKHFWEWKVPHGNGFELVWNSQDAFRRGEECNLLREVRLTENQNG